MRAVIQRVSQASVKVEGKEVGSCGRGLLVLLGVGPDDTPQVAERLWSKIRKLRIFADEEGKFNRSLADINGEVLVVSQFTLYANCRKGNRPSFTQAGEPTLANALYEHFCDYAQAEGFHVGRGVFGANMQVSLVNDGPVTIMLDTDELLAPRHPHSDSLPKNEKRSR